MCLGHSSLVNLPLSLSLCVRSMCKHQFTDRRAHHSCAGINKLAVCPSQLDQHTHQTAYRQPSSFPALHSKPFGQISLILILQILSSESKPSLCLEDETVSKNVLTPPNEPGSLTCCQFSSYGLSCSGWSVTLICEWQLSCFKLPIDLVSHGLAHGPWREAFVCSQPCALPICCWDRLQYCHQPH